jgi:hypothetical protein
MYFLCCSMYFCVVLCIFCVVLCIVCFVLFSVLCVCMCTELLPLGGYPIAVKYIISYERVTFCSLLLYITINLLSFVYAANSYISEPLKNFTNVLVTSITLSYTNATKCPLCSTKSSDNCGMKHMLTSLSFSSALHRISRKSIVTVTNFVHSLDLSLHVIIFLRTPFIWTLSTTCHFKFHLKEHTVPNLQPNNVWKLGHAEYNATVSTATLFVCLVILFFIHG